jgi:anhydro-N-acetylmuramic acid kinase
VPVVFDFRSHNVVQGGEGAPLAPLYHQYLFANEKMVAVINIGGISNISFIRKDFPLIGYDLGPGNCLSDAWVAAHLDMDFDKDGSWASQGEVSLALLEELIKDPFFSKAYPKSIGKEYFSLNWLNQYIDKKILLPEDVQATLIALTVRLIAIEVQTYLPKSSTIYICGGGVKNKHLMNSLTALLSDFNVLKTDDKGISSDYLEAMMMAWLGWTRIEGIRHDLSSMMGGADQQLLGLICQ